MEEVGDANEGAEAVAYDILVVEVAMALRLLAELQQVLAQPLGQEQA